MSLLSGMTPPVKNLPCKVRTYSEELDPKDSEILKQAVADLNVWPSRTLSLALAERKIFISDISIGRHRKGQCSCAR